MASLFTTRLAKRLWLLFFVLFASGYLLKDIATDFWQDEVEDFERLKDGMFVLDLQAKDLSRKQKIGVLLFGDGGMGNAAQHEVASGMWELCKMKPCALALGDNIYPSGVASANDALWKSNFEAPYKNFIETVDRDFWMLAGNHDRRGSIAAQIRYSQRSPIWKMPARDYKIPGLPNWLNVYMLDTTFIAHGADIPNFQSAFEDNFREQLKRASEHLCDKIGWRIIATHHPLVSNGARNNLFRENNIYDALFPFLEECGIHLVFSGHEHLQQHVQMQGVDYLIQGAAASTRERVKPIQHSSALSRYLGYDLEFAHLTFSKEQVEVWFNNSLGEGLYNTTIQLANHEKRKKQASHNFE